MRIGISNAVLYPESSEITIEKLSGAGFDLFEFFYNCDYEATSEFLGEIKSKSNGADFVSIHPYTAFAEGVLFFSACERRTVESIEKYRKVFLAAKELGVSYFTFHGDRFYGASAKKYALSEDSEKTLSRLSGVAKECGIRLCLENVSWCKSSSVEYVSDVSERVAEIGFTLDLKQARRAGIDYKEYIKVMGDKLCNIHVSDFDEARDCLLPGKGKFDFYRFREELESIGYKGDILIEVYSQNFSDFSELAKSKEFLEKIFS